MNNKDEELIWEAFQKSRIEKLYDYGYRPHPEKRNVVVIHSSSKYGEAEGDTKEIESPELYQLLRRYEMFRELQGTEGRPYGRLADSFKV